MRVFLTGASGFIGTSVARQLLARGDEIVTLVRNRSRSKELADAGCELLPGSLHDTQVIREALSDCEAMVHCAAVYELGASRQRRAEMFHTNVHGTRDVLEAALHAGMARCVYVSTVTALGNSRGAMADETFVHHGPYLSYYEQTKDQAHRLALRLIARGLPCVIVMPSPVYGPGDQSQIGNMIRRGASRRLVLIGAGDSGCSLIHVDDAATGIVLALDRGQPGEQYILTGEAVTLRQLLEHVESASGRRARVLALPASLNRLATLALSPVAGHLGLPPNLRELYTATNSYTYWASPSKARQEIGLTTRPLLQGLAETLRAEGLLAGGRLG